MALLEGYVWGLSLCLLLGPVFFTLLKSSLQYGTVAGLATAGGILLSDIACVLICYTGSISFFQQTNSQFWIALIGAALLMTLGLKYIFKPNLDTEKELSLNSHHYFSFFAKGFLVNFINPFVFLVWLGIMAFAKAKYSISINLYLFLSAVLSGILTTDVLKVFFAQKLKTVIQPAFLTKLYKVIGFLLFINFCKPAFVVCFFLQ